MAGEARAGGGEDWGERAARLEARLEARKGDAAEAEQRAAALEAEHAGLLKEKAALAGEAMRLEARHAELRQEAAALAAQAAVREALEESGAREEEELRGRRAALGARESEVLAMSAAEAGFLREFSGTLEAAEKEAAVALEAASAEALRLESEAAALRGALQLKRRALDGLRERAEARRRETAGHEAAKLASQRDATETKRKLDAELLESGPRLEQLGRQTEFLRGELDKLADDERQTEAQYDSPPRPPPAGSPPAFHCLAPKFRAPQPSPGRLMTGSRRLTLPLQAAHAAGEQALSHEGIQRPRAVAALRADPALSPGPRSRGAAGPRRSGCASLPESYIFSKRPPGSGGGAGMPGGLRWGAGLQDWLAESPPRPALHCPPGPSEGLLDMHVWILSMLPAGEKRPRPVPSPGDAPPRPSEARSAPIRGGAVYRSAAVRDVFAW